ncbi:MAG: hypothetical protein AAB889_01995 [Patescibacteria group bacterium]
MSDLPTPASDAGNNPINTNKPIIQSNTRQNQAGISGTSVQKEIEFSSGMASREPGLVDAGTGEIELPKEVASVGVKAQPTTVQLPSNVQNLGVQTVGQSGPAGQATTVVLPLTDDQIAQGLHQGITSSFRWLAEWCIRRLKQVHMGLKTIHGKLMRVKYA